MKEIIIHLDTISPVDLYGVNDTHLHAIRKQFPAVSIVARGTVLKARGIEADLELFSQKMDVLIAQIEKKGKLPDHMVEEILQHADPENGNGVSFDDVLVYGQNGLMVKARTLNQRRMVAACDENDMIFAIGPAGTGKTYTAVALAVRALKKKEVRRIILTRPAVEAGENLGFLPGDLKEKIDPYLQPLYDALHDMIPASKLQAYMENGIIQIAPLAFMRGRTLDNAFVILDEAQNATENQLKMFLTRMGPNARFVITGDVTQIDLPRHQPSGLLQARKLLANVEGISFITLDQVDIIRHQLVKRIVEAYGEPEQK
ncbi:MAG: PhoH family protein [Flavobacteriales bacterium]|nr:PhoH family protein [Flavobacteriales bacterium]